ncbi:MAG: ketoacyl-ACP synthase III [Gemmatimonadetes bacterium]|nr:MAG: ketoacyl-ACP synthase III [Gemmatimonadota bacterium]
MSEIKAQIIGLGHSVPEGILTNDDLSQIVDTSDEWIYTRTGIRQRRIADANTSTSDLATDAAQKALKDAGIRADQLDMIILGTASPDMVFPASACVVQDNIGAKNAAAFDISAACSGFLYGLSIARGFITSGMATYVLVIGAEVLSKILNFEDRSTCVLFGDGAGAAVLTPSENGKGVLSSFIRSDGAGARSLNMPAGGTRRPTSPETLEKRLHYIHMAGNDVFKYAVRAMGEATRVALEETGTKASDVDLLIPHQANIRIIEATAKRVKIPMDKVFVNLDQYGNTSAASIPIALNEARQQGRIQSGDLVVLVAFGGGYSWGSVAIRW